jgi:hypothetical protein
MSYCQVHVECCLKLCDLHQQTVCLKNSQTTEYHSSRIHMQTEVGTYPVSCSYTVLLLMSCTTLVLFALLLDVCSHCSQYLDKVAQQNSNVHIYRAAAASVTGATVSDPTVTPVFRDKVQMVNTALQGMQSSDSSCLLVQIDADELWTAQQLNSMRDMFLEQSHTSSSNSSSTSSGSEKTVTGESMYWTCSGIKPTHCQILAI